jgi:APA family basic amino acid/polyamine antiporter
MPEAPRPFRVPFAPLVCTAGALMSLGLTLALPNDTWLRLFGWSLLGFIIYFGYGYRHSRLRHPE